MLARSKRPAWLGAVGNSSWYLAEKLARLAIAFIVNAWIARYLGPHNYGTLAFGVGLLTLASFLVSWGVESIVVRDLVQQPKRQDDILSTYMALRLAGGIVGPALAITYAAFKSADGGMLLPVTAVLAVGTLLTSFDLTDWLLQARHKASLTSFTRAGAFIVSSLFKCWLILNGADLIWFAVATIVENVVTATVYTIILRRLGVRLSLRRFRFDELQTFVRDGKYMILAGAAVTIYSRIDVIVIGSVISETALANYAIASAMLAAWNLLGASVAQALTPHVAAAHARSEQEFVTVLRWILLGMTVIAAVGSAMIALLSDLIFHILLGSSYTSGAGILKIVIWSSIPSFLGVATSQIIVNERLYSLALLRTFLGMALMLALVYPAAIFYGPRGVAILLVASTALATGSLLFSRRARQLVAQILKPRSAEVLPNA